MENKDEVSIKEKINDELENDLNIGIEVEYNKKRIMEEIRINKNETKQNMMR